MEAPRNKRSSIAMIQSMLGRQGISRTMTTDMKKKKQSLSAWGKFESVDWQSDAKREYDSNKHLLEDPDASSVAKLRYEIGSWTIPALVGILTATSGCFIEKTVEWLGDMRSGYCGSEMPSSLIYTTKEQCGDGWVPWTSPYLFYVIVSTVLATVSATMTWAFAPMARGSGIPEIKTILGGFKFPEVLETNTLIIKILGLGLSVAAGLSCGKEGPLVHIACCWSNLISKRTSRLAKNEAKQRELLSCACAAGVAVAFGAPLGGVLFSLEEASTLFPNRTMIRAFFSASVAAMTLAWWNPTGSGKLTMFEASYDRPAFFWEYGVFIILGALGGCIGSVFVHYNVIVSKARAPGTPFRAKCHIILEVCVIALVTAITSFPLLYTNVLSNVTIRALFHDCTDRTVDPHSYMLDLCTDDLMPKMTNDVCLWLLLAGLLRFVQMIFTFGTGAPAGLFIPSLYTGAVIGRVTGLLLHRANLYFHFAAQVSPAGIYAMIGAASVLGGVCRVTISLVVIMFELTSGLQLIVPFMLACLTAKWVGDYFTPGIYDYCITIRKYPYLHEPDEVTYSTTAKTLMDEQIDCIHLNPGTVKTCLEFLSGAKYGGYPITMSADDSTFLGYIYTKAAKEHLQRLLNTNEASADTPVSFVKFIERPRMPPPNAVDLSALVDEGVLCVPPEMPAAQLHSIFRNLGIKLILCTKKAKVVGMITKKSFIKHIEELHAHGPDAKPEGGLAQSLLPK